EVPAEGDTLRRRIADLASLVSNFVALRAGTLLTRRVQLLPPSTDPIDLDARFQAVRRLYNRTARGLYARRVDAIATVAAARPRRELRLTLNELFHDVTGFGAGSCWP